MFWPMTMGRGDRPAPFHSKLSLPAEGAVVILGAGASAPAGAPLIRGFIDQARDFEKLGLFSGDTTEDVRASIEFYDSLRSFFKFTEEDIENIENLLSLAELTTLIPSLPITASGSPFIEESTKRFVEAVLVKAIRVAAPSSDEWLGLEGGLPHKYLVGALAHYKDEVSVIALNYDCLLEYVCFCMGVPFTYSRSHGEGIEILKLHGSTNWSICANATCPRNQEAVVSPLEYHPLDDGEPLGTIEAASGTCSTCTYPLQPLIVPPVAGKQLEHPALRHTWERAFSALSRAETMVSVGYSLPESDTKVRQLLHVGLSSDPPLRQAMIVLGSDDSAAERWGSLFRESWRNYRLDLRMQKFQEMAHTFLWKALAIQDDPNTQRGLHLLPLLQSPAFNEKARTNLQEAVKDMEIWTDERGLSVVDWVAVAKKVRNEELGSDDRSEQYRQILAGLGFDWIPVGSFLPSHGTELPTPDI